MGRLRVQIQVIADFFEPLNIFLDSYKLNIFISN